MRTYLRSVTRLLAALLLPIVIGLSAQAGAVDVFTACSGDASKTDVCKNIDNPGTPGENPIIHAIGVTILILSFIIGIASVIMIIVAGLSFITANGDAQAIARARSSIIYALVGIIIVGLAQALVAFVLNKI
jgi:hypothetical protein